MPADWQGLANCVGLPGRVFFPPEGADDEAWYEGPGQEAVAVCKACVVRKECFAWALQDNDSIKNGVYGGTTPKDRNRYLEAVSLRAGHHPSGDPSADQG